MVGGASPADPPAHGRGGHGRGGRRSGGGGRGVAGWLRDARPGRTPGSPAPAVTPTPARNGIVVGAPARAAEARCHGSTACSRPHSTRAPRRRRCRRTRCNAPSPCCRCGATRPPPRPWSSSAPTERLGCWTSCTPAAGSGRCRQHRHATAARVAVAGRPPRRLPAARVRRRRRPDHRSGPALAVAGVQRGRRLDAGRRARPGRARRRGRGARRAQRGRVARSPVRPGPGSCTSTAAAGWTCRTPAAAPGG